MSGEYRGPLGMPINERDRERMRSTGMRSLGGPVLWNMDQAYAPSDEPERGAESDGMAVLGRYPRGFITHVLRTKLLGHVRRDQILHVCSGSLGDEERWTVDIRLAARPTVIADARALPFKADSFLAAMVDPPYSDQYARDLYGVENPRPSVLLREVARVVVPGGRIGVLHVAVPFSPRSCWLVKSYGITTGPGFRIRAFTVYEKHQAGLFAEGGAA